MNAPINIGILVPTFNRHHYLSAALNSVLNQTALNFESIVIDNGSSDGTAAFMATVTDPRIRYIVNETNIGMIGSINKGVSLFSDKVEWCTILGDDDMLDEDCIKNLLQAVEQSNAKSIVHSHRTLINREGGTIREAALAPREESALEYLKHRSYSKRQTYLTGVLFNRKMFNAIGGYPVFSSGLATDDAFIFCLALQDRLVFDKSARAFIRVHEHAESMSLSGGALQIRTIREFDAYCRRAAAQWSAALPDRQVFDRILGRYVGVLCSGYWLRAFHAVLDRMSGEDRNRELERLFAVVQDDHRLFSARIRLAVMLGRRYRVSPESAMLYRYIWGKVEGASLRISYLLS